MGRGGEGRGKRRGGWGRVWEGSGEGGGKWRGGGGGMVIIITIKTVIIKIIQKICSIHNYNNFRINNYNNFSINNFKS